MKPYILLALGIVLGIASCTQPVPPEKLKLKNAEKAVVIEGFISYAVDEETQQINTKGPFQVRLSTSSPYFEKGSFVGLSGATIWMSDNMGQKDYLTESSKTGIYLTDSIEAIPNRTYALNVTYQGKTYTANSFMPVYVALDSTSYEYRPKTGFLDAGYYATIYGVDPGVIQNYYRLRVFKRVTDKKSGLRVDSLFDGAFDYQGGIAEDKFFDGNFINFQLPYAGKLNDSIRVELCSIDKSSYDYYYSLGQAISTNGSGGPFSPPPANPKTNFTNGAYGYFSAESFSRRKIVIQ